MNREAFERLARSRHNMVGHVDEMRAEIRRLAETAAELLKETAHCLDYDPVVYGPPSNEAPSAAFIPVVDLRVRFERGTITMTTATITITPPTTRVDGTPLALTDIDHIDIFDAASATPAVAIGTVKGPGTTFTTGTLAVGGHGFTAVVTDTTGHVSAASNVATVTVPATLANPSPATITATLNP